LLLLLLPLLLPPLFIGTVQLYVSGPIDDESDSGSAGLGLTDGALMVIGSEMHVSIDVLGIAGSESSGLQL
jgi:hypothetical protein